MNKELENRLKELDIEDLIWGIYLIIIAISYYSNHVERDYFINNNQESLKKYRNLQILIFSLAFLIYLYFATSNYKSLVSLNENDSPSKVKHSYLVFIASIAILFSGSILLYVAIKDENLEVEIAFN